MAIDVDNDLLQSRQSIQGRFASREAEYFFDEQQRYQLNTNLRGLVGETFKEDFAQLTPKSFKEVKEEAVKIFNTKGGAQYRKDVLEVKKIMKLPPDQRVIPLSTGELMRRKNKMANWLRKLQAQLRALRVTQGYSKQRYIVEYLAQMVAEASDFYGRLFDSGLARKTSFTKDVYSHFATKFDNWRTNLGMKFTEKRRNKLMEASISGALARSLVTRTSGKNIISKLYRRLYGIQGTNEGVEVRQDQGFRGRPIFEQPSREAAAIPSAEGGGSFGGGGSGGALALPSDRAPGAQSVSPQALKMLQHESVTQVQTIMDSSLESIVESDGQIIDVVFTGKYKGKKLKWLEGLENMVREAAGGGILDDLSDALDIDVGGDGKKGKVRGKKGGRASRMKRRSAAWLRRMKRSATSISSKFPNIPKPAIPRIPKIPGFDKNTLKALKNNPMFKGAGKLAKGAGPAGAVIAGLELYDAVQSGDPRQIGRSIAGIGTGMGGAWAGAAIGSMIFPGIGTAIGGLVGGIAGSIMGENMADTAMDAMFGSELKPDDVALPKTLKETQAQIAKYKALRDKYAEKTGFWDYLSGSDEQKAYEKYRDDLKKLEEHAKKKFKDEQEEDFKNLTGSPIDNPLGYLNAMYGGGGGSPTIPTPPTSPKAEKEGPSWYDQAVDSVSLGWSKAKDSVSSGADSVAGALGSAWSSTKQAASSAVDSVSAAGSSVAQFAKKTYADITSGGGGGQKSASKRGGSGGFNAQAGVDLENLNPTMKSNLAAMDAEYQQRTGRKMLFTSGYRSYAKQKELWDRYGHNRNRAAPPGNSMHNWGLAVDVNPPDANKLAQMGLLSKYGFHRNLMNHGEPWHIEPSSMTESKRAAIRKAADINKAQDPSLLDSYASSATVNPAEAETTGNVKDTAGVSPSGGSMTAGLPGVSQPQQPKVASASGPLTESGNEPKKGKPQQTASADKQVQPVVITTAQAGPSNSTTFIPPLSIDDISLQALRMDISTNALS